MAREVDPVMMMVVVMMRKSGLFLRVAMLVWTDWRLPHRSVAIGSHVLF